MKIIPKNTIIKIEVDTGFCGMDSYTYYKLSQDYTEEELDNIAWDMAIDNAEMYGIYNAAEMPDDVTEEEEDSYSDNISGVWKIVEEDEKDIYDEIDTETL